MTQELTELAKNWSLGEGERRDDLKLRYGARGGDRGATESGEAVAVGAGDALDHARGNAGDATDATGANRCIRRGTA